jgi:hypothetical protein
MNKKIIGIIACAILLMLVVPVYGSSATKNEDVEFKIYAGNNYGNVGIGITMEATNNGEEPADVTFIFAPICLRPYAQSMVERKVQPQETVKESFYFPIMSFGLVLTQADVDNSSNFIERIGHHIGQLTFLNPV